MVFAQWRHSPLCITPNCARMMLFLGAPLLLLHCCDYVSQTTDPSSNAAARDVVALDAFCGERSVYNAYRQNHHRADAFDLVVDRAHDLETVTGFFKGVQKVLKVVEGGILHAGPPCSSFTWLNRGTSKRCTDQPEGDRNEPTVVRANLILGRFCLLLALAIARCTWVLVEQPRSSIMPKMNFFVSFQEQLIGILDWLDCNFHMAMFGSPTAKPTKVFGTCPWMGRLYRKFTGKHRKRVARKRVRLVKSYVSRDGRRRVCGNNRLKRSQVYPKRYGKAVCKHHMKNFAKNRAELRTKLFDDNPALPPLMNLMTTVKTHRMWRMANLAPIQQFLVAEADAGRYKPVWPIPPRWR